MAGINSRNRALLYAIHACYADVNHQEMIVYGTEATTDMARLLRWYFPRYLGSECSLNATPAISRFPIPVEDPAALSFKTGLFDAAITIELLERLPALDAGLRELARILKPGGWHIGTCSFAFLDKTSIVMGGPHLFEIPGWDILERAKRAGFKRAFWKFVLSRTFGVVAEHSGGVFVLCLRK